MRTRGSARRAGAVPSLHPAVPTRVVPRLRGGQTFMNFVDWCARVRLLGRALVSLQRGGRAHVWRSFADFHAIRCIRAHTPYHERHRVSCSRALLFESAWCRSPGVLAGRDNPEPDFAMAQHTADHGLDGSAVRNLCAAQHAWLRAAPAAASVPAPHAPPLHHHTPHHPPRAARTRRRCTMAVQAAR